MLWDGSGRERVDFNIGVGCEDFCEYRYVRREKSMKVNFFSFLIWFDVKDSKYIGVYIVLDVFFRECGWSLFLVLGDF